MDKKIINNIDNFVFDLDGTLLNSNKEVSQENIEAIHLLHKLNKNVIIATGRPFYMNLELFQTLKIKMPIISANGGLIYDLAKKQLVLANSINKESLKRILNYLEEHKIDYLGYISDFMIGRNFNNPSWFTKRIYPYVQEDNKFKWDYRAIDQTWNSQDYDVCKLLILNEKVQDKIPALLEFLKNETEFVYTVSSQAEVIDIMPLNVNKGNTLKIYADLYNIDLNRTAAFGDAANDKEMLAAVTHSVAMGNSVEELKQSAKYVADTNNNSGVAKKIKEFNEVKSI